MLNLCIVFQAIRILLTIQPVVFCLVVDCDGLTNKSVKEK